MLPVGAVTHYTRCWCIGKTDLLCRVLLQSLTQIYLVCSMLSNGFHAQSVIHDDLRAACCQKTMAEMPSVPHFAGQSRF